MIKFRTKILSVILSVLMLASVLPASVYAIAAEDIAEILSDSSENVGADSVLPTETAETEPEVYALGEDVSMRTENTKYIRMSDGSYYVAMYDNAVHYQDEDGNWQEIDNTLVSSEAENSDDVSGVATSKGKRTIKFANNSNSSKLVAIKQDDYKISFGLVGANKTKAATVTNPEAHDEDATQLERITVIKKAISSVIYEDILEGVDLEYVVSGDDVKENIIVKAKADEYVYQFDMKLNKLTAEMQEGGTIALKDEKSGEVVYTISLPFMVDANGVYSDAVTYSLEQIKNKEYRITVTADSEWMNDESRAYPVTIDPPITADSSTAVDTYVYEGAPNTNYRTLLYSRIGFYETYSYCYYWKLTSLPTIPDNSIVTDATLSLYQNLYSGTNMTAIPIVAYLPQSSWDESITWSTQSHNGTTLDYQVINEETNSSYVTWDITRAVKNWYYDAANKGILFKSNPYEGSSGISAYASFGTADRSGYEPTFTVTYRSIVGLEDYYTYHTQSIGRAGTGYICDYTSTLTLVHTDITSNSATLPFTLSHIYNEGYAGSNFTYSTNINTANFSNMYMGKGWKLSVQESIITKVIGNTTYYVYNDGDGTDHYISYVDGEYIDEDGLGLTLTITNSSTGSYTLTDKQDNQKIFVYGILSKIVDANGNTIKMVYNGTDGNPLSSGSRLQSIIRYNTGVSEANAETLATFSYDTSGYLATVYDSVGRATSFGYSSGLLTTITKPDASVVYYEYTDEVLCNAYDDEANYGINYNTTNYTSQSSSSNLPENYKKVIGVYEYYIDDSGYKRLGKKFEIENIIGKKISYWDLGNDNEYSTSDDVITTYMFDYKGRTVNVYSTDSYYQKVYGAGNVGYADNSSYTKQNNHLGSYGVTGTLPQNLLTNGSAETSSGWSGIERSPIYSHSGLYSFTLYSSSTAGSTVKISQELPSYLRYNSTFTVSAYVKVDELTSAVSGGGVYLMAESDTEIFTSDHVAVTGISNLDSSWQRISLTFTTENSLYFTISVCLDGAVGTVYIDDIQLEENAAPSSYNLVVPFSSSVYESSISPWTTNNSTYCYLTGYQDAYNNHSAIYMHSTPYDEVYAEQTIPLYKSGATTFLVSAWAIATSIPQKYDETFSLIATVEYTDSGTDTDETFVFPFQAEIRSERQYVSGIIVPSRSDLIISQIKLKLSYSGNMGTAYFYDISLVEEEVQTYSYDANGNLKAANQTDNEPISTMYDNLNNLTSQSQGNENYEYTYKTSGNKHLLDTVTNDGVTMSFTYDSRGNVTGTVVTALDTTKYLASYNTYTSDGNFTATSEDTAGNVTQYGYNSRNQLTTITNANGVTSYQDFDGDSDRQNISYISGVVSVHYYYTDGMLSSLVRGGYINGDSTKYNQTYYFTYDGFGNTTSISVGGYTLVSYTYDDYNGNLLKTTYGNGNYIENVYDDLGRVVQIKVNGVVKYNYSYNGNGDLYSVEDVDNNIITCYNYDSLDRLISSVQKIGNTIKGYTSYEYDGQSRVSEYYCGFAGVTGGTLSQTYAYTYDAEDGNLTNTAVSAGNIYGDSISYTYDALKRLSAKSVTGQYRTLAQNYSYRTVSGNRTTTQISGLNWTLQGSSILAYTYSYDSIGNITAIYKDGSVVSSYSYDSQSQLVTEIDYVNDVKYIYNYDTYGNIRSVDRYTYSTGTYLDADIYSYTNTSWLDRLTAFNGTTITYDAIGNPLSYNNGSAYTFTWKNGRELASVVKGGVTTTYKYDAGGQRVSKTYGSTTYNYYYADGMLVRQTWGTHYIDFLYDESGTPYSLVYDGVQYYYVKNVQGDVVQIRSVYGTLLVEYSYDAWGNVLSITGSYANTLGVDNPIRYRSYYYDFETGFYYLQSRYYDPSVKRFINADDVSLLGANSDFASLNLYAYCGNNPVARADSGGEWWHIAVGAIVGATISFVSSVANDISSGDDIDWVGAGISALFGAASGALSATGLGPAIQILGGAVLSGAENIISQGRENGFDKIDYTETVTQSVIGGITSIGNGVSKGTAKHLNTQGSNATKQIFSQKGIINKLSEIKPAVRYYKSQTYNLFYSPLKKSINATAKKGTVKFIVNMFTIEVQ